METTVDSGRELAQRLERGEVATFSPCPFPLPSDEDQAFLRGQRSRGRIHKNISYDPGQDAATGYRKESETQAHRLCAILGGFADTAASWLASRLPCYVAAWQPDRVS